MAVAERKVVCMVLSVCCWRTQYISFYFFKEKLAPSGNNVYICKGVWSKASSGGASKDSVIL